MSHPGPYQGIVRHVNDVNNSKGKCNNMLDIKKLNLKINVQKIYLINKSVLHNNLMIIMSIF